jgi:type I restriction enzyme S subunit
VLLERIKAEKEQLVRDKKIKKEKPLPAIKLEEIPFEIPESWAWCRLGDVCRDLLGGFAFDSTRYSKTETSNQVIRLGNVKPNQLVLETGPVYIDDEYSKEAGKSKLQIGDVLITMTGTRAKKDYLFSLYVNDINLKPKNLFLNQRVGCFRFGNFIEGVFINNALKDTRLIEPIFESSTGAANQANIGISALKNIVFPIPPLCEQHRIVAKVEQLLTLCDELETSIKQNQNYTRQLLQVALKEALDPGSRSQ